MMVRFFIVGIIMNIAQIHALKSQIPCSTQHALALLKKSDGDINQAVALYHQDNMTDIMNDTGCDKAIAEKYYHFFTQNKQRAIHKIKALQSHEQFNQKIITTQDEKCRVEKAGFEFYIQSKNSPWRYDDIDDYVFIPVPDCWLISDILAKYCDYFDYTSFNEFNHKAILNIIHDISLLTDNDKKIMQFYQEIIAWLKEKSKIDNIIEIYGNI